MQRKIIIAGFGGQGVVLAGNILARACIYENKHVTAMVSYGVEMRGGTANTSIVISDKAIASPVVENPDIAIILNQNSLDKFEETIAKNGLLVLNSSLIIRNPKRADLDIVSINATEAADELGNTKIANIIALGAFIRKTNLLRMENIEKAIEEIFSEKKQELIELNKKALQKGAELCS